MKCVTLSFAEYDQDNIWSSFICHTTDKQIEVLRPEVARTKFAGSVIAYTTTAHEEWGFARFYSSIPVHKTTIASNRLARIHNNPPDCAVGIFEQCPLLHPTIKRFDQRFGEADVNLCAALTELPCPGICAHGTNATKYLDWIFSFCDVDPYSAYYMYSDFRVGWPDYAALANASYRSLFPWDWRVEYNATAAVDYADSTSFTACPSLAAKLLAFAIVNVVVFIVSLVLGRRDVVYHLTCHCCGKRGSRMWVLTALIAVALNLGANAVNAAITKSTPGFSQAPIGGLILLWASRPRMAWAVALLVKVQKNQSIYFTQAFSALLAETILQLVGAVYIGITLNYARTTGYLL